MYNSDYIVYDSIVGYRPREKLAIQFSNHEYLTKIVTNERGFRSEPFTKRPDIVLLGDSFVMGIGVDQEKTVASVLEKSSEKKVWNLGVEGYGTLQETLLWEQLLDNGEKPTQITFLLFYGGNDLNDNVASGPYRFRPTIHSSSASGLEILVPTQAGYNSEIELNSLYTYTPASQKIISCYLVEKIVKMSRLPKFENVAPSDESKWEALNFVSDRISLLAEKNDAQIVVVYIPTLASFESGKHFARETKAEEKVASIFAKRSIPFVNLREKLNRGCYFPIDMHWNAEGHSRCAEVLNTYLMHH